LRSDPEVQVFLQPAQDLRIGARSSRSSYQYTLQGGDVAELRRWSGLLLAELRRSPSLRQVTSDQTDSGLALRIGIDRETASRVGVTPRDIDSALSNAFGQRQIATSLDERQQFRVVLEAPPESRDTPDDLQRVFVRSGSGTLTPVLAFVSTSRARTPLAVNHQGQFPSVTLTFDLAPGVALDQAAPIVRAAERRIRMPDSIHGGFAGTAQTFQASIEREPYLILAALIAVYLVLGMLYESLIHPLTILSTLPPAAVGALLALFAFGLELDVVALIGIVLLVGIVAKNAIMMIDVAIDLERNHDLDARAAIKEAAVRRFRPILMTTLAATCSALPLALGSGVGAELRSPLGVTIVGGLIGSQLLTLFTTPVVYVMLDRFSKKQKRVPIHAPSSA
jgi:multidrug efflux pump subunit AcrB